jgi:hypothetical protein
MDHLRASLDQLRFDLARSRRSAWVYAMVGPAQDGARLLALDALLGPKPNGWREQLWQYEQCTFVSAKVTGRQLADWCRGGPQAVHLGSVQTTLDLREDSRHTVVHMPSLAQYANRDLDWPALLHIPSLTDAGHVNAPQGYLVGAGTTPSFPDLGVAFRAFFYHQFAITGAGQPQLNAVHIWVIGHRARIRRVRASATAVDVRLGGTDIKGTVLELNGAEFRTTVPVEGARVVISLPDGLPADAWIWLKSGREWIDFRALAGWGGRISRDVEHEIPRDRAAELSHLLSRGEGQSVEYKQKLPIHRNEARNVLKTVVAFANGVGGTIVFGIEDETNRVIGIVGKAAIERQRLNDLVRDLVRPSPKVRIETTNADGHELLLLQVVGGTGTIHALMFDANKPEYYVRREATTYYALPDELEGIAAQRQ